MRHVIWDWNGTLLDDLDLVVGSVNEALAFIGERSIDRAEYRDHYTRPVVGFYEALLGRRVEPRLMADLDRVFHEAYAAGYETATLATGAHAALARVGRAGATQSVASMLWHDMLIEGIRDAGIDGHMLAVDGHTGGVGDVKAVHLEGHVSKVRTVVGAVDMVLIGDITDDADAASAVGIDCVLYDGGTQPTGALQATGRPVAETLAEALTAAGF